MKRKSFTIICNKCLRKMELEDKFVIPKKGGIKLLTEQEADVPPWYVLKCGCGNKVNER